MWHISRPYCTTWIDIYRGIHIVWATVYVFMIYQHDTSIFSISRTSDSNTYVTWWNVDQCWTNFQCFIGFFQYVHVLMHQRPLDSQAAQSVDQEFWPTSWVNPDHEQYCVIPFAPSHAFPCNSSEFSICRFIRVTISQSIVATFCAFQGRTNPRLRDHYPSFSSRPNCISSYIVSKTYPMKYPIKAQFGPVKSQLLTGLWLIPNLPPLFHG